MSSTRGHRRGRSRGRRSKPRYPLVKPDEFRQPENVSQDDEEPRVQKLELTVNEAGESAPKELAQGSYLLNGLCVLYRKDYKRST